MKFLYERVTEDLVKCITGSSSYPAELKACTQRQAIIKFKMVVEHFGGEEKYKELEEAYKTIDSLTLKMHESGVAVGQVFGMGGSTKLIIEGEEVSGCLLSLITTEYSDRLVLTTEEPIVVTDQTLIAELAKETALAAELVKQSTDLFYKAYRVVHSVETLEELFAIWPEAKDMIPPPRESKKFTFDPKDLADILAAIGDIQ